MRTVSNEIFARISAYQMRGSEIAIKAMPFRRREMVRLPLDTGLDTDRCSTVQVSGVNCSYHFSGDTRGRRSCGDS